MDLDLGCLVEDFESEGRRFESYGVRQTCGLSAP
jgi:hypothetical protein